MDREIRAIRDADLQEATGTPGIHRRVAAEDDDFWFGHVEAAPDTLSGWHHHGETTTIGYLLDGRLRFEFGPGGSKTVEVGAGEYFVVPAGLIHREGNLTDRPGRAILVRVGEGPPVVAVDGPEPG